jgi:hypothetical protein
MSSPPLDLASCLHTAPTAEPILKRLRMSRRGLNLPKLVGPATVNPKNFMRSHQHGTRRSRARPPNLKRCFSKDGAELGPERGVPLRLNDPQGAVQEIGRSCSTLCGAELCARNGVGTFINAGDDTRPARPESTQFLSSSALATYLLHQSTSRTGKVLPPALRSRS